MVVLTMHNSRFLGCSRYPECRNTRSMSIGVKCPKKGCDGSIVQRRTRRGKTFYGCSKYPKCDFASWDEPVDRACSSCSYPILVIKSTKRRGTFLRCPNCKAEFPFESRAAGAGQG
jgi:DNA topoisomerase-1